MKLLNFKITLPVVELYMVSSSLVSNGIVFSADTPVDIRLVTFLLISNVSELNIGAKTKKL